MDSPVLARVTRLAAASVLCASALISAPAGTAPASATVAPEAPTAVPLEFPITVDTTVPAGGQAWVGSPSLPSSGRRISVRVAPGTSAAGSQFAAMYTVLATMTNNQRLLTCATYGALGITVADALSAMNEPGSGLGSVAQTQGAMRACFQVVAFLASHGNRAAQASTARASACQGMTVSIPVTTVGSGDAATVTVSGAAAIPRRPALRISCRAAGGGLSLAVSTRSAKVPLRRVVGDRLTVGFANPAGSTEATPLTLTFGRPR